MADQGGGRRLRRAALAAVPVAAAAAVAGVVLSGSAPGRTAAQAAVAVASAPVVRTDLANTAQVSGSLGYAGSYALVNQQSGTAYTALPGSGAAIRRGQELYAVDGTPVILFYGGTPEWRPLYAGVTPGRDVAQLNRNLIALGYGPALTAAATSPAPPRTRWTGGKRPADCPSPGPSRSARSLTPRARCASPASRRPWGRYPSPAPRCSPPPRWCPW